MKYNKLICPNYHDIISNHRKNEFSLFSSNIKIMRKTLNLIDGSDIVLVK